MPSGNETSSEEITTHEDKQEILYDGVKTQSSMSIVAMIIAFSPVIKPRLWLWINSGCLAFAIVMAIILSQYDAEDVNFPSSSFLFYSVTVVVVWCVEAGSSIMAVEKSDKCTFYFVCFELLIAIYYVISISYFLIRKPHLNTSDKESSVRDTAIDIAFYFLSCCYNVYEIKHHRDEHSTEKSIFSLSGEIKQSNEYINENDPQDHKLNVKSDVEMV